MSVQLSPLFSWRGAIASKDSGLTPTVRHVALNLSLHMSERGDSCFPAVGTMVEETGLADSTVRASLRTLCDEGWLVKEERFRADGSRSSNTYTATVPERLTPHRVPVDPPLLPVDPPPRDGGPPPCDGGRSEDVSESVTEVKNASRADAAKAAPRQRARDLLFDAMTDACGIIQTEMTRTLHGQASKAVKELRGAGATPDEVLRRAEVYRATYPDSSLTPAALCKHWAMMREAPVPRQRKSAAEAAIERWRTENCGAPYIEAVAR